MRKEKPKMRYQKTGVDLAMLCSTLNLTLVITTPPYIVVSGQGDGSILDGGSGRASLKLLAMASFPSWVFFRYSGWTFTRETSETQYDDAKAF